MPSTPILRNSTWSVPLRQNICHILLFDFQRCASDVLGNSSQRVLRRGICHRSGCQALLKDSCP